MSTKKGTKEEKKGGARVNNEYFDYQKKYSAMYDSQHTVVLMQIGDFYEMYSTNTEGADLQNLSLLLDMQLSKKGKGEEASRNKPNMMGFPIRAINKHRRKMVNAGWTVVVIDQVTPVHIDHRANRDKAAKSHIFAPAPVEDRGAKRTALTQEREITGQRTGLREGRVQPGAGIHYT